MTAGHGKLTRSPLRRLFVEALESRLAMDADALPWGGDARLTLSFAPDGALIAGSSSTLFAALDAVATTAEWQQAILRAFQTWAAETNASIGVVPDGGQPFGIPGATRDDARFGDIRIGAAPLEPGVLAIAIPADNLLAGTWVGDVIFNSEAVFANAGEIFAVALHEAGHVFGVGHSDDPASPMHVHGITPATDLTAADIASLQSRYGVPHADFNEQDVPNDSLPDATHLQLNRAGALPQGSAPSVVYGKISSSSDIDVFRVETPGDYFGPLAFQLRTRGISLLTARLRILDANGDELASQVLAAGDVLTITIPSTTPDRRYYAAVEGAAADAFGIGDYSLVVRFDGRNAVDDALIERAADGTLRFLPQDEIGKLFGSDEEPEFNDDAHADDDAQSGLALEPSAGFAPGVRYDAVGSIVDASDVDFYSVQSSDTPNGVMTVRVRSLEAGRLMPRLAAYDEDGAELPVRVLVNGGGELVVQVSGLAAKADIDLSVQAADPDGPFGIGNYQMTVGFGQVETTLPVATAGTLSAGAPTAAEYLHVGLPQLFHFAMAVAPAPTDAGLAVFARIYDANDNLVHQLAAPAGETRSAGSVLLKPGTYRVVMARVGGDSSSTEDLSYELLARASSDPFLGDPNDPTFQPVFECPELPGFFCYPGGFISPNPFLWEDFLGSLPAVPQLSPAELARLLLGDWWTWVWAQSGVNGPPLARDDAYLKMPAAAGAGVLPLNVLANDFDPESSPMVAVLHSTTAHGMLSLNPDGTVDYVAEPGFAGVDVFTYAAYDFVSESQVATVRISVGLRGDGDQDHDVDGADFLQWQRTLGAPADPAGGGADFDGSGMVDRADRVAWGDNFGVSLAATANVPGDFDADGDADGADFLAWQRTLGGVVQPAGSGADGNADGVVNVADLDLWRAELTGPAPALLAVARGSISPLAALQGVSAAVPSAAFPELASPGSVVREPSASRIARRIRPAITQELVGGRFAPQPDLKAVDEIFAHWNPEPATAVFSAGDVLVPKMRRLIKSHLPAARLP